MELLKIVLLIVCIASAATYLIVTVIAYQKRQDQSFSGGSNILLGWWIIFPYGENGIDKENSELVLWARISAAIFWILAIIIHKFL